MIEPLVCLKWAQLAPNATIMSSGHRLPTTRVLETRRPSNISHAVHSTYPRHHWRLRGEKFPSHCDGSEKNLLKSGTHALSCHYKARAWTLKIRWSGSLNRVRFDYILDNRFGMYDSRQANLQLLSSLAFSLLFSYAAGTAPGLEGLYESVNARRAVFKVGNRGEATLTTNCECVYT